MTTGHCYSWTVLAAMSFISTYFCTATGSEGLDHQSGRNGISWQNCRQLFLCACMEVWWRSPTAIINHSLTWPLRLFSQRKLHHNCRLLEHFLSHTGVIPLPYFGCASACGSFESMPTSPSWFDQKGWKIVRCVSSAYCWQWILETWLNNLLWYPAIAFHS